VLAVVGKIRETRATPSVSFPGVENGVSR
jgi:hypothetical protein